MRCRPSQTHQGFLRCCKSPDARLQANMLIKQACQRGIWTQLRAMGQLSWRKPPISDVTGLTSLDEEATEG